MTIGGYDESLIMDGKIIFINSGNFKSFLKM